MKRLWTYGVKAYIEDMWNIVEFATTSLYITTYTMKFVSFFLVCSYDVYFARAVCMPHVNFFLFSK